MTQFLLLGRSRHAERAAILEHFAEIKRSTWSSQTLLPGQIGTDVVFASLRVGECEIMLQERTSLLADSPAFDSSTMPGGSITLYFRVDDVDAVVARLPAQTQIVKPLETTWYGMREIWLRDPDGYVLTIGTPHGEPPAIG